MEQQKHDVLQAMDEPMAAMRRLLRQVQAVLATLERMERPGQVDLFTPREEQLHA